jgi:hypothetical protein
MRELMGKWQTGYEAKLLVMGSLNTLQTVWNHWQAG